MLSKNSEFKMKKKVQKAMYVDIGSKIGYFVRISEKCDMAFKNNFEQDSDGEFRMMTY